MEAVKVKLQSAKKFESSFVERFLFNLYFFKRFSNVLRLQDVKNHPVDLTPDNLPRHISIEMKDVSLSSVPSPILFGSDLTGNKVPVATADSGWKKSKTVSVPGGGADSDDEDEGGLWGACFI